MFLHNILLIFLGFISPSFQNTYTYNNATAGIGAFDPGLLEKGYKIGDGSLASSALEVFPNVMTSNTTGLQIFSNVTEIFSDTTGLPISANESRTNYLTAGTVWIRPNPFNVFESATPNPDSIIVHQGMGILVQYSYPSWVDPTVYSNNCKSWFFQGINITIHICLSAGPHADDTIVAGIRDMHHFTE